MSNRHFYASVLDDFESRGLMYFPFLNWRAEDAETVEKPLHRDNRTSQQYELADEHPAVSLSRLRIEPSSPSLSSRERLEHKRTDTSSTVVTEIHAPQASHDTSQNAKEEDQTSSRYTSRGTMTSTDDVDVKQEEYVPRWSYSSHNRNSTQGRVSTDTAIYTPEVYITPPQTADGHPSNEASTLSYFQRPPSPPLTPEGPPSSSLDDPVPPLSGKASQSVPPLERIEETRKQELPNPEPSEPIPSEPVLPPPHIPRPKSSIGVASISHASPIPSPTSTVQRSEFLRFDASHVQGPPSESSSDTNECPPDPENDMPTEMIFFDSSPRSAEFDGLDFPAILASKIDYNVLPWEDARYNHMLPSALRQPPSSTVSLRSSFDSAAPPPISLGRFGGNYQTQSKPAPNSSQSQPPPITGKPRHPKSHILRPKSLSSLFHGRSRSPLISVAYQNTIPGKAPVEISVSRTAIPSIPALFPKYKGSWPPEETPVVEKGARARLKSITSSLKPFSALAAGKKSGIQQESAVPSASTTSLQQQNIPVSESQIEEPFPFLSEDPAVLRHGSSQPQQQAAVGSVGMESKRPVTVAGESTQKRSSWLSDETRDRVGEMGGHQVWRRERRRSDIAPGLM